MEAGADDLGILGTYVGYVDLYLNAYALPQIDQIPNLQTETRTSALAKS